MSYLGVKFNNTIRKIAGMAIMDVAFSNTSINGVQNKVIKAKFDEIEDELTKHSFGTYIDIINLSVSSYTIPSDGYIRLFAENGHRASCRINGNLISTFGTDSFYGASMTPVRKNMVISDCSVSNISNAGILFIPLV